MALPNQVYEIIPLPDGTYLLRVYTPSMISVGVSSLNVGRTLVQVQTFANQNLMITGLKALIAAPPILS